MHSFPHQVILMPNGCMCCRVRGDLVDALKRLIASASGIEVPENTESTLPNGASEEAVGGAGENSTVAVSGEKIAATSVDASSRVSLAKEEQERGKLDGIVLECSGLDELAPVLQVEFTYITDPTIIGVEYRRSMSHTRTHKPTQVQSFNSRAPYLLLFAQWCRFPRAADILRGPFCPRTRSPRRSGVPL